MSALIRLLNEKEALARVPDLCEILRDCVDGGASIGFMAPLADDDAAAYWRGVASAVGRDEVLLFVAEDEAGGLIGTVQIGFALKPNQPHRADLMKLLVHRTARGRGLSRQLMTAAEQESRARGRWLLVLDTATGEPAEAIYERFGWVRSGVIPEYALFPDGRYCATTVFYKRLAPAANT